MKFNLGTQDKKKVIMAASLGAVALGCIVYAGSAIFGGGSAPPTATTTVTTSTTTETPQATRTVSTTNAVTTPASGTGAAATRETRNATTANAQVSGSRSQDPALRLDLIALSEHTVYAGTGRNVFSAEAPPPPAPIEKPAPFRPAVAAVPVNTGPPPPPPIELQYYGYATQVGAKKRIFLKHGDDIFIAAEGDIVNHRYRVKQVQSNSVVIEDILNNNTQPIPLSLPNAGL